MTVRASLSLSPFPSLVLGLPGRVCAAGGGTGRTASTVLVVGAASGGGLGLVLGGLERRLQQVLRLASGVPGRSES